MQKQTARAVIFSAPGQIDIKTVPICSDEGILFRSELMAISSGTEMLFYRGTIPEGIETDESLAALSGQLSYPIKYGYMNVGRTESGERRFAFYPHQDLFYAQTADTVVLPDSVSSQDGVFLANMETAVGIVQDLSPVAGDDLLVVGQGTVGLLVAEILALGGLYTVITSDCYPIRRSASKDIGCLCIDPDSGDAVEAIRETTGGRGVDKAVNLSGSEDGLQLAIDSLAFEGEVLEASWYGSRETTLSLGTAFHRKRLSIRSSQVSNVAGRLALRWSKTRRLGFAVRMVEKIRPSKYITHTYSLEDAAAAFEHLDKSPEDTIQVVLKP
jgi:threonine dehydrogenase-like Zn-dependent dehydrogenase